MWVLIMHTEDKCASIFITESHDIAEDTSPSIRRLNLITATIGEGPILRLLELDLIFGFSTILECFNRPFFTHA